MSAAADLVTEFCTRWSDPDPDVLASYFTEDAVYHNIPMDPVVGRNAIREFLVGFLATFEGIDFVVHRQTASGSVVMNERTDVLRGLGKETPLPVMGVFEVVDGKIAAWRDYFDMGAITAAFGGGDSAG
ncbi:limonene-1,2-epoxide hydrolase family protein [Prescottella subtropica]|uniref:limonene-1,2-epoxide hydrolase family protein n=1 Tax=Prescottella subtropica TaxID=2545757 RepID=UPI0010F70129|nr:limonene-1,2-epoxide hydrolase family protein [Prescottella subtropica]